MGIGGINWTMRRVLLIATLALASALGSPGTARPATGNLGCGAGKLVINITFRVVKDVDTGVRGNNWAFDNYTRTVKVWRKKGNTFCAATTYKGTFTTIAGPSPGGTGTVPAGITGTFSGFYRTSVFRATLLPNPAKPRFGNIGTFNFNCSETDEKGNCPGSFDWPGTYFSGGANYKIVQYKFVYKSPRNGTWTEINLRSRGDITGKPGGKK